MRSQHIKVKYLLPAPQKPKNKLFRTTDRTYEDLCEKIHQGFTLEQGKYYKLTYMDEQGEPIELSMQEDFDVFKETAQTLVLELQETPNPGEHFIPNKHMNKRQMQQQGEQKSKDKTNLQRRLDEANQQIARLQDQRQNSSVRSIIETKKDEILNNLNKFKAELKQKMILQMKEQLTKHFDSLKSKRGSSFIHKGTGCNGLNCSMKEQMVGVRYQCYVCRDYNLCQDCELTNNYQHEQDHPFLKLYNGKQSLPNKELKTSKDSQVKPIESHPIQSKQDKTTTLMKLLLIPQSQAAALVQDNPSLQIDDLVSAYFQLASK